MHFRGDLSLNIVCVRGKGCVDYFRTCQACCYSAMVADAHLMALHCTGGVPGSSARVLAC